MLLQTKYQTLVGNETTSCVHIWGLVLVNLHVKKPEEYKDDCWVQVQYLNATVIFAVSLIVCFPCVAQSAPLVLCVSVHVCLRGCVCLRACLVYREQTPDSERQSRHPVWTDRSRANVAHKMHFINTHGHITYTHTHKHTFNHTAESQVPQEPAKIEKPPILAGMTSKKQTRAS